MADDKLASLNAMFPHMDVAVIRDILHQYVVERSTKSVLLRAADHNAARAWAGRGTFFRGADRLALL